MVASLVTTSPSIIPGCIANACLDKVSASVLNSLYMWLKRTASKVGWRARIAFKRFCKWGALMLFLPVAQSIIVLESL